MPISGLCREYSFGNFNLGLHNIKAGNFFGNSMFNLNTRVNFNKVEVAVRGNEEFNRTGAEVINVFHQLNGCVADCLAQFGLKRKGRGNFHQFLVAALYGAVALEQMHNVALRIAQNLNFDMFRAFKVFFKVNFIAAESFIASDLAMLYTVSKSSLLFTMRMPRPPPPLTALSITGKPCACTKR